MSQHTDHISGEESAWLESEGGHHRVNPHKLPARVPEILAPAGGRAQFMAALKTGADAVYLGLTSFNARARADNFTVEDLAELVPLAHAYGMKVLVTLNVLVKDAEWPEMIDVLGSLEALNVDAVILQDFGVVEVCRRFFPGLRLHGSTQMAIHNVYGVMEAARMGLKRVVLARETTTVELKRIYNATRESGIELEAFCHGSLCYSYSGLCFFSGAKDARSGNRGECAYTCRKPYKILSEPGEGFLFSMKDLDTSKELDRLVLTGVSTLKIEGRKKDAQYVSSVVRLYRKRLNDLFGRQTGRKSLVELSDSEVAIRSDLDYSFQRERTSFFLQGRYRENGIDLDNPTHKGVLLGKVDVVRGRSITFKTKEDLACFDGIRVDSSSGEDLQAKYQNKVNQFSLRRMKVKGSQVKQAKAGSLVTLFLPEDSFRVNIGDLVYKSRSASLKDRTQALAKPPEGYRLRQVVAVDTVVSLVQQGDKVVARASVSMPTVLGGALLTSAEAQAPYALAKTPGRLLSSLEQHLGLYGTTGFKSRIVEVDSGEDLFLAPRLVKELKRDLQIGLEEAYQKALSQRKAHALASLPQSKSMSKKASPGLAIKLDRLNTLEYLDRYLSEHSGSLQELVFEPKPAFLGSENPATVLPILVDFAERHDCILRLAIPTLVRAWDEPQLKLWIKAFAKVSHHWEVGNPGAMDMLRQFTDMSQAQVSGDFSLYTLNSMASRYYHNNGIDTVTFSVEDDRSNILDHLSRHSSETKVQLIIYKDTPLFMAEACSLTALHGGCPTSKVCGYRSLKVQNHEGEVFHVAHERCKSVVYGEEPYSLVGLDSLVKEGVDLYRIDFLTRPYTQKQMWQVLAKVFDGGCIEGSHSANYERTLL